jgi:phosphohistidine phosphatase SixA
LKEIKHASRGKIQNMVTLLLMRHGQAAPPIAALTDFERPLTTEGKQEAVATGKWICSHLPLDTSLTVLVSTAKRTTETWLLVKQQIESYLQIGQVKESDAFYSFDEQALIEELAKQSDTNTVLFIGHNPTVSGCCQIITNQQQSLHTGQACIITLPDFEAIGIQEGLFVCSE